MTATDLDSDPFLEKSTRVHFLLGEGEVMIAKSVTVSQIRRDVIATPEDLYRIDGSPVSFPVRSNAAWTATIKSDPDGMIVSPTSWSGGPNRETGDPLTFILKNDPDLETATATITFTWLNVYGETQTKDVVINGFNDPDVIIVPTYDRANCYMVRPGGDGVEFPVDQANADGTVRIGPNDQVTLKLIWTDSPKGVAPDGAVKKYSVDGVGDKATISVAPGTSKGNAVIGAVVNGSVVWSWHIWVVDYDPDHGGTTYTKPNDHQYTWMDRNLEATSGDFEDDDFLGLLYQWGRKDPFPGLQGYGVAKLTTIYNSANSETQINYISGGSASNLEASIADPLKYFYNGLNNDWLGTSTRNDNLWGDPKTVYDPCPFGWRVPYGSSSASPWSNTWTEQKEYNNQVISWPQMFFGYFPAAGMIQYSDTKVIAGSGNYWSGYANGNLAYIFRFDSSGSGLNTMDSRARSAGQSVRCVKE